MELLRTVKEAQKKRFDVWGKTRVENLEKNRKKWTCTKERNK